MSSAPIESLDIVNSFECPALVLNFDAPIATETVTFLVHKEIHEQYGPGLVRDLTINLHFKFAFVCVSYRCTLDTLSTAKVRYSFRLRSDQERKLPVQTDKSLVDDPIVSLVTIKKKDFLTEDDYCHSPPATPTTPTLSL